MKNQLYSHKGQALVLIVFGMVVLLGFTALAIDGSMVYADRRHAQNVSDSAALAGASAAGLVIENNNILGGAGWCSNMAVTTAKSRAITAAQDRFNDNNLPGEAVPNVSVQCIHVPSKTNGKPDYLEIITSVEYTTKQSFLAAVINLSNIFNSNASNEDIALTNKVYATSRVYPGGKYLNGFAMAALGSGCGTTKGGVLITGSTVQTVVHGGIFSNDCVKKTGSGDLIVQSGSIQYNTTYSETGSGDVSPNPQKVNQQMTLADYYIPPPDCSSLPYRGSHSGGGTLQPGRYYKITSSTSDIILQPGLYCIEKYVHLTGGGTLTGNNVTIYIMPGGQDFKVTATRVTKLSRPEPGQDGIPGVVIYLDNDDEIQFAGAKGTSLRGIIYAPLARVEITGSGEDAVLDTQIVARRIEWNGSDISTLDFTDNIFGSSPQVVLYK